MLSSVYNDVGQKQLSSQYRQKLFDVVKKELPAFMELLYKNNKISAQEQSLTTTFASILLNLFNQQQIGNDDTVYQDWVAPLIDYSKEYFQKNPNPRIETLIQPLVQYFNAYTNTTNADKLVKADDNNKKQEALKLYQQSLVVFKNIKDEDLCFDKYLSVLENLNIKTPSANNKESQISNVCFFSSKVQQAKTLNSIAKVQLDLKQNEQAIDSLKQALTLIQVDTAKPTGNTKLITSQQAQELYNQILAANKDSNSDDLSRLNPLINSVSKILDNYKVKDAKSTTAETLSLIGQGYTAKQEYQNAMGFYKSSLALWKTIDDVIKQADTRLAIAKMERTRGNLTQAKAEIEKAIDIIESESAQTSNQEQKKLQDNNNLTVGYEKKDTFPEVKAKQTNYTSYLDLAKYLESKQSYYDFYIDLLMQSHNKKPSSGYDILAFQASERSKSRSLRAIFNKGLNKTKQAKPETTETNYIELTKIPSLSEIQQQLLDENTLLLEYTLGEERSYLWAVTKNSIQTYQLPKRTEIDKLSRQFIELLKSPSYRLTTRGFKVQPNIDTTKLPLVSDQLSQALIAPVAEKLGKKRLLIISDGALQYVPFAALRTPPRTQKQGDYQPLFVDNEIVGLPSASLQILLQRGNSQKQKPSKTLAMLADPIFSRSDERVVKTTANTSGNTPDNIINTAPLFQRLLGTRKEASQITSLVSDSQKLVKLDSAASYQNATSPELSKYRFIHFATHGVLDAQRPERSGVIFSIVNEQGELQRSLLSTPDVFKLNLASDLVVLSACTTALGKEIKGEGLIGLTGGLMYAGSKSVVSSFWDVDDGGTAELMTKFYSKMLQHKLSPATALRAAQLEMWNSSRWQAPYYWAAFSIQGDGRDVRAGMPVPQLQVSQLQVSLLQVPLLQVPLLQDNH